MKVCRKCGASLPLTSFGRKGDGLQPWCKPCRAAAARARRRTPQGKAYHDAYNRAYYAAHAARLRAYRAAYRRANVDRILVLNAKYRALKRGAAHEPYDRAAIFAAYGNACVYCGAEAQHLDHVVPLSKGGADAAHNLLPACADCNLSKGSRSLAEWALSWAKAPEESLAIKARQQDERSTQCLPTDCRPANASRPHSAES